MKRSRLKLLPLPRFFIMQDCNKEGVLLTNDLRAHGSFPVQQMLTILSGHSSTQVVFKKKLLATKRQEIFLVLVHWTCIPERIVVMRYIAHQYTSLCAYLSPSLSVNDIMVLRHGRFGTDDKVRILWRWMRGAAISHVPTASIMIF